MTTPEDPEFQRRLKRRVSKRSRPRGPGSLSRRLREDNYVPPKPGEPEAGEALLSSMEGERVVLSPDGADDPPGIDPRDQQPSESQGPWYEGLFRWMPRWAFRIMVGALVLAGGALAFVFWGGDASDEAAPAAGGTPSTTQSAQGDEASPPPSDAENPASEAQTGAGDSLGFVGSPLQLATADVVAGQFGGDVDEFTSCVNDEVEFWATDEGIAAMANPDISTWPDGVAEFYADVLEFCLPLEPYYLDLFGQFEFFDSACPRVMTNQVIGSYSWLRFLEEGILDPDKGQQIQTDFDLFVARKYQETQCFGEA